MALTIYDVIKKSHISTKSYRLNNDLQQLVLEVHPHANKPMIKEALKKLFNVEADKIRTRSRQPKNKKVGGRYVFKDSYRKTAIITLKRGQSVDMMGGLEASGAEQASNVVKGE